MKTPPDIENAICGIGCRHTETGDIAAAKVECKGLLESIRGMLDNFRMDATRHVIVFLDVIGGVDYEQIRCKQCRPLAYPSQFSRSVLIWNVRNGLSNRRICRCYDQHTYQRHTGVIASDCAPIWSKNP